MEIAKTYDAGIEPSDILECVPAEGILLCTQALVGVGDTCIVTWPAYQSLYEIACSRGAEVRFWRARGGGPQRLRFDVRDLVAEVQAVQRTGGAVKMILINFPHNPTGCSLSPAELEQVVRIARGCGAYLIGDEMYRGLEYEGNRPLPAVCELYEKGVSLSGMSKVSRGGDCAWLHRMPQRRNVATSLTATTNAEHCALPIRTRLPDAHTRAHTRTHTGPG